MVTIQQYSDSPDAQCLLNNSKCITELHLLAQLTRNVYAVCDADWVCGVGNKEKLLTLAPTRMYQKHSSSFTRVIERGIIFRHHTVLIHIDSIVPKKK